MHKIEALFLILTSKLKSFLYYFVALFNHQEQAMSKKMKAAELKTSNQPH